MAYTYFVYHTTQGHNTLVSFLSSEQMCLELLDIILTAEAPNGAYRAQNAVLIAKQGRVVKKWSYAPVTELEALGLNKQQVA